MPDGNILGPDPDVTLVRVEAAAVKVADLAVKNSSTAASVLKGLENTPGIAAVVACGTTTFEATTDVLEGNFGKAGVALLVGGAEIGAGFGPPGASDLARGATNKLAKEVFGEKYGAQKAISEHLVEGGIELAGNFSKSASRNAVARNNAPATNPTKTAAITNVQGDASNMCMSENAFNTAANKSEPPPPQVNMSVAPKSEQQVASSGPDLTPRT